MSTTRAEIDAPADPAGGLDVDPRVARSRAKLLTAATELLVEHGPDALTVDRIAERSGVSKSTLYRHWPSHHALVVDVLRHNMPDTPPIDTTSGFEHGVRAHLHQLVDHFTDPEWGCILPALFSLSRQHPEIDHLTDADRAEKVARLKAALDAGVAEGVLPPGLDPQAVSAVLLGPPLMTVLGGIATDAHAIADYALDRFMASYR